MARNARLERDVMAAGRSWDAEAGGLSHLTGRELIAARALARRRSRRDPEAAKALIERIDAELERRRRARLDRLSVPQL